ncbi:HEAT repeat domain-containing protein [Halalkalibacter alkalisediminis]|uniref:HEAT repeat domain-containing protein n=1 Tax=Halalkalibacter alkalisediminis TaxID=935616 RepID=A0ABV6NBV4_9BACI|nr:HEAT repeat domain-containing protein [Halalkalibacter alkalisediminis]
MTYLISLIMILFLLNITLLIYLLIRKNYHQRKQIRKMELEKEVTLLIEEIARNKREGIPSSVKRSFLFYEVLQEIISHYIQLFNDQETSSALKQVASDELSVLYRKKLRKGSWSERMNVLYYIEDFEMKVLRGDLWLEYETKKQTEAEKYQIIRALATLHDKRLLDQIKGSPDWPYFLFKECFRRYGVEPLHFLIENCLTDLSERVQVALLDVAIESKDLKLSSLFDELLLADSPEVRIRALKAIFVFGATSKEQELVQFQSSDHWVERMLFARIAGKLKLQRYCELLVKLLSDSSWWVRQAAAESLARYESGLFILEFVYETSKDKFARDTAYQWLGEAVGQNVDNE